VHSRTWERSSLLQASFPWFLNPDASFFFATTFVKAATSGGPGRLTVHRSGWGKKRGPTPKIQQQMERIQPLPKTQQRFVMQVTDIPCLPSRVADYQLLKGSRWVRQSRWTRRPGPMSEWAK
jgi:hypothetical protein